MVRNRQREIQRGRDREGEIALRILRLVEDVVVDAKLLQHDPRSQVERARMDPRVLPHVVNDFGIRRHRPGRLREGADRCEREKKSECCVPHSFDLVCLCLLFLNAQALLSSVF